MITGLFLAGGSVFTCPESDQTKWGGYSIALRKFFRTISGMVNAPADLHQIGHGIVRQNVDKATFEF